MFSKEKCWIAAVTSFRNGSQKVWGKKLDKRLGQTLDISWETFAAKMLTEDKDSFWNLLRINSNKESFIAIKTNFGNVLE